MSFLVGFIYHPYCNRYNLCYFIIYNFRYFDIIILQLHAELGPGLDFSVFNGKSAFGSHGISPVLNCQLPLDADDICSVLRQVN